jgi:hypothetical protein
MNVRFMAKKNTALILACGALTLSACADQLRPAPGATLAGHGGATSSAAGVTVVTMTPDFPGIVDIESAVTPIKVKITNKGTTPVRIRYADFKLSAPDGTAYAALPLYKIDSSVTTSLPVGDYYPIADPAFRWNRFRVAPYYAGLYPGLPWYHGGFYGAPYGWDYYDTAFANVDLPTPEMRRNVLPEGVLDPGGSLEGWLYFQHVPPSKKSVTFEATINSERGANLGQLSIPYDFAS